MAKRLVAIFNQPTARSTPDGVATAGLSNLLGSKHTGSVSKLKMLQ